MFSAWLSVPGHLYYRFAPHYITSAISEKSMSIWPTKNADSQLRHAPSFVPKVKNFLIQNCDKIVNRHHLPTLKLPKIYKSVCMQGQQFILNNFAKYFAIFITPKCSRLLSYTFYFFEVRKLIRVFIYSLSHILKVIVLFLKDKIQFIRSKITSFPANIS